MTPLRALFATVLLCALASTPAAGQAVSTASIGGTVRDSSGAVLPRNPACRALRI